MAKPKIDLRIPDKGMINLSTISLLVPLMAVSSGVRPRDMLPYQFTLTDGILGHKTTLASDGIPIA
ncbi:MAG: hypothetical protein MUP68_07630, partial [Deltaproteobacteria bacterium]|nr:hypothetical protein [Deltaproteobacteria bacterium]